METSYNTWKETVACNTSCLSCHTHDNSGKTLSVEIKDRNCTSMDCHPPEKLAANASKYKETFTFKHETHIKEYATNLKMQCTGCHAYPGKGDGEEAKHFDIDIKACIICHFIRGDMPLLTAKDKKSIDVCTLCHKDVDVKIMIYKKEFDHLRYGKELKVECTNCHFETIHGNGNVNEMSCYYCHKKVRRNIRKQKGYTMIM